MEPIETLSASLREITVRDAYAMMIHTERGIICLGFFSMKAEQVNGAWDRDGIGDLEKRKSDL